LLRSAVVVIHAGAGVCGLIAGLAAIAPPRTDDGRGWLRALYVTSLTMVLVSLVMLLGADWDRLDPATRGVFSGLTAVAALMVYRITRAYEVAGTRGDGWREQYIRHVAFTYVALWEGFVILPALRLPYPHLTVPLIVIAVLLLGGTLLDRYKARVLLVRPRPAASAPASRAFGARPDAGARRPDQPRAHAP
jgi:hypothetical protein